MNRRRFLLTGSATVAAGALRATPAGARTAPHRSAPSEVPPDTLTSLQREELGSAVGPFAGRNALGRLDTVWSVTTTKPFVGLTFDDGPSPEFTPAILDVLASRHVHATFNVMGHNAAAHPDLLRRVVAEGHEIGNHTMDHLDLAHQTATVTRRQMLDGAKAIEDVTGQPVRLFRPPRGEVNGVVLQVCAEKNWKLLLWSTTRGPDTNDPAAIAHHVSSIVEAGDIVDLHDGIGRGIFFPRGREAGYLRARRRTEVAALPALLDRVAARGLRLVPASELIAAST